MAYLFSNLERHVDKVKGSVSLSTSRKLPYVKLVIYATYIYIYMYIYATCRAFVCAGPTLWNKLPGNMRDNGNLVQFRKQLKHFYFPYN